MKITRGTQIILAATFGVLFLSVVLVIAITIPEPSDFQYFVFRITLALAAGGVAAMIPGIININLSNFITAGGALAVFAIVYFYNPNELVIENLSRHISQSDLMEHRDNAKGLYEHTLQRFYVGVSPLSEVINAGNALLNAELELSSSPQQKVSILESAIARASEIEDNLGIQVEIGAVSSIALMEIALHISELRNKLASERGKTDK